MCIMSPVLDRHGKIKYEVLITQWVWCQNLHYSWQSSW
jgi:hypothetical protein